MQLFRIRKVIRHEENVSYVLINKRNICNYFVINVPVQKGTNNKHAREHRSVFESDGDTNCIKQP